MKKLLTILLCLVLGLFVVAGCTGNEDPPEDKTPLDGQQQNEGGLTEGEGADQEDADQEGTDQGDADQEGTEQGDADQEGTEQEDADQEGTEQEGADQGGTKLEGTDQKDAKN